VSPIEALKDAGEACSLAIQISLGPGQAERYREAADVLAKLRPFVEAVMEYFRHLAKDQDEGAAPPDDDGMMLDAEVRALAAYRALIAEAEMRP
jgi:hypothetical protein